MVTMYNGVFCQGNHAVIKSADEYSCQVDSTRGPKDFNFDQVFMPESTQEKVFEDTNVRTDTCLFVCLQWIIRQFQVYRFGLIKNKRFALFHKWSKTTCVYMYIRC